MSTTRTAASAAASPREDLVVLAVLAVVGLVGIGVGVVDPSRTVEPSIGSLMVIFVVFAVISERRRQRSRTEEHP